MLTSEDMVDQSEALDHLQDVIFEGNTAGEKVGQAVISNRKRVQCTIKSSYSETKLVPGLNDLLIANPIPAAVSRFRMGSAVLADPSLQVRGSCMKVESRKKVGLFVSLFFFARRMVCPLCARCVPVVCSLYARCLHIMSLLL